jgi:heme exporter protein A
VSPSPLAAQGVGERPALLRAEGIGKRFGLLRALHPVDLEIEAGHTLGVLGPNGAGKSTLLRLLAGLARPSEGTLAFPGAATRPAQRAAVGLVGHSTFLYPALTARENLELAARLYGLPDYRERALRLLAAHGLAAVAERRAGSLSRGMSQRLAIARALIHDPTLLLLDEPFTGLDPRASEHLAAALQALRGAGRACVLVTHDLARAAELCDQALVLVHGRVRRMAASALEDGDRLQRAYLDAVQALEGA